MAKTLTKIDAFFTEADSRFKLTGTYENQTLTLFDGDTFFDEVDYSYSERAILARTNTPLEEFYKLFQRWSKGKGYGFIRSYAALLIEYNPTHNYDGTEKITTTTDFGKVVSSESEGTTTNTPTLTSTTERSMYGYNSSSDVDADKAVTTAGGKDVTGVEGSGSVTESGTEKVTVETEKGGNLGLTTNAQLITGELKLRMYDLQKEAIANFINEYTVEYIEIDGAAYSVESSAAVYSAGDGIDITNGVISIDSALYTTITGLTSTVPELVSGVSDLENDVSGLTTRVTALEGYADYSLEEKAIGHWVNGSVLYQKTYLITTGIGDGYTVNIDKAINKIINIEGYTYTPDNNYETIYPFIWPGYSGVGFRYTPYSGTLVMTNDSFGGNWVECYLTLRYIK